MASEAVAVVRGTNASRGGAYAGWLALLVSVATLLLCLHQTWAGHGVIRARNIKLYDRKGHMVALLGTIRDGTAGVFVYGSQGTTRAMLGVRPSAEADMILFDEATQRSAGMSNIPGTGLALMLCGPGGEAAVTLTNRQNGDSTFELHSVDHERRLRLTSEGGPSLGVVDRNGRALSFGPDPRSRVWRAEPDSHAQPDQRH